MEAVEFDDILDDWFIESLKTYKDLHVYQLEHPTQVIEWTSEKTVCVTGYSLSKNEILELRLPLKLFADENKNEISKSPTVVSQTARSAASGTSQEQDVIRRTGSIAGRRNVSERGSRIAARLSSPPQVLHGAQSSDVQLTELTSGRTLYKLETDSTDPLSFLQFVSDTVFLAGCCNGSVYVTDTRTSAAPQLSPPPASSGDSVLWWADASVGPHPSSCRVVRLSSSGQAVVSDLRSLGGGAVCQAQLDVQERCCNLDHIRVSWAPTLDDCISVSGFSGVVQIYNTCGWSMELQERQPLFQHRGHVVSSQQTDDSTPVFTTAHIWHPERPRTLLSAASDGSVHVWDWVDPEQSAAGSPIPRT
uniref:WD repeat domain 73 n=1 Tax=Amphiprion ocellaris TaxID=80972 RepID=A0AAQ5ZUZ4_AMPOC